jgi:Zn-dependent oligopeptidase
LQARHSQGLDITSTELEPYTQLPAVMQGLSSLLQQMFGISVEPRACSDIELLSPESVGYDVLLDGSPAAVMYLHPGTGYGTRVLQFPATAQASSSSSSSGSKLIMSIGIGSCDISTLAASTMWELVHELGHAVHLLLSSSGPLMHLSGLYWPKDLVELPSQLMEMLLTHPPSVAQICRHSSTGQQMPGELAGRLAGHFSSRHHSALGMQDKVLTALVDVLYASYGDASDFWEDVHGEMCSVPGLRATFKQLAMIPTAAHHQGLYYMYLYAWVWAVYIWQRVRPGEGLAVGVEAMGVVMRELLVPGNSRSPLLSLEMCLAGLGLEPEEAVQVQEGCVVPVVDGTRLRQALWVGQADRL